jgi:hypothetical protein
MNDTAITSIHMCPQGLPSHEDWLMAKLLHHMCRRYEEGLGGKKTYVPMVHATGREDARGRCCSGHCNHMCWLNVWLYVCIFHSYVYYGQIHTYDTHTHVYYLYVMYIRMFRKYVCRYLHQYQYLSLHLHTSEVSQSRTSLFLSRWWVFGTFDGSVKVPKNVSFLQPPDDLAASMSYDWNDCKCSVLTCVALCLTWHAVASLPPCFQGGSWGSQWIFNPSVNGSLNRNVFAHLLRIFGIPHPYPITPSLDQRQLVV